MIELRLGEPDLSLKGLQSFRAGPNPFLKRSQLPSLLLELAVGSVEVVEDLALLASDVCRLLAPPIKLLVELLELFALVEDAPGEGRRFFGCQTISLAAKKGSRKSQRRPCADGLMCGYSLHAPTF